MPLRAGSRLVLAGLPAVAALLTPHAGIGQPSAADYLQKMAQPVRGSYQARQLVVHLGRPQSAAVVDIRATPSGTFVRAEGEGAVTKVWKDEGYGLISAGHLAMQEVKPPGVPLELDSVMRKYDVSVGTPTTVLGVAVVPLELTRKEDERLVERMWVDGETGIVYRRELYGPRGGLIGMSTIIDMRWGQPKKADTYAGHTPSKVRTARSSAAPRTLPYGYSLRAAYTIPMKGRDAEQWVYSDGMHALSVFRLPGTMRRPADYQPVRLGSSAGWAGPGPGTWMWQGGRAVWAVVAEEPQIDASVLTRRLPKGGPSLMSRLGSWWARAFRWIGDLFS